MLTVFDGEDAMVSAAAPVGSDLAGSGSRTVTLTPSSNLRFALTSTVALSGVIRATPASGFTVTVNGTPSGVAPSKTTGSDGAFNLRLAPASYSLAISSNGTKPGRPEHFNMNTAPFGLTADRLVELTPRFAPVTFQAYGVSGAALALDRVPYGVNSHSPHRSSARFRAPGDLRLLRRQRSGAVADVVEAPRPPDGAVLHQSVARER